MGSPLDERQRVAEHLVRPLREGKPELGWEGDPRLVLAFHAITHQWELWRHEPVRNNPDRHVLVAKGPPGQDINPQAVDLLIRHLIDHDTHRRGNSLQEQLDRVIAQNERHDREQSRKAAEALMDPLGRFYTEAGKTLGVTKTFFPT